MDDSESARRSFEITGHDNQGCPECRGAAGGDHQHYALGKYRQAVGMKLGLDFHTSQQLDLKTLLERQGVRD